MRNPTGHCAICLSYEPLSYEHIPPKAAFNSGKIVGFSLDEAVKIHPLEESIKGARHTQMQGGAGMHSLCKTCNSNAGAWYAPEYILWAQQAHWILQNSELEPGLIYPFEGYPQRFIKQVVAMMCSVAGPDLVRERPDLARFVLQREAVGFGDDIRIFASYNPSSRQRLTPEASLFDTNRGQVISTFSELACYPFCFVLTIGGPPPDDRLIEITNLSRFSYDDWGRTALQLPSLPSIAPIPGIYQSMSLVRRMRKPTPEETRDRRHRINLARETVVPEESAGRVLRL